jgi:hypothetical protein
MSEFMMDRGQEYVANEFVVAAAHRDLVMNELDGTGASAGRSDPDLDLALVTLPDPAAAADLLRRRGAPEGPGARASEGERSRLSPYDLPLDTVLTELRALFANRYGGWEPTLGKNRVMRGVQFFPYPSFGGDDMPTAAADRVPAEPGAAGAPDREAGHRARVVVLDTGIYPLDTLAGRYLARSSSVLRNDPDVRPWWEGHATFISGLILDRAPAAELEIHSILHDEGRADVWKVAQHLVRYADSGADVLTAAFGCFTVDGKPPLVLERAIARLTPTVVVVAAAGNYGAGPADGSADSLPQPKTPIWPAAFESVVAVGATDDNGKAADFSPKVPWVDLIAPGVKVKSDFLEGDVRIVLTDEKTGEQREEVRRFDGTAVWSGTSFAAAAVAGAVAAQTVRGRRTAYEALDRVRRGIGGPSRHGIDVATFS